MLQANSEWLLWQNWAFSWMHPPFLPYIHPDGPQSLWFWVSWRELQRTYSSRQRGQNGPPQKGKTSKPHGSTRALCYITDWFQSSVLFSMTQCLLSAAISSPCCGTLDPGFYRNQGLFSLMSHWRKNTVLWKSFKNLFFSVAAFSSCLYSQTIKKRTSLVLQMNPTLT